MIDKYQTNTMSEIWSLEHQYEVWWKIERAAVIGWIEVGEVPEGALEEIDDKVEWTVSDIKEKEAVLRHDMLAFLETIEDSIGSLSAHVHKGITSSDIQDTDKSIRIAESIDALLSELNEMKSILEELARQHRWTVMMGRTHAVHAEPVTFGLKCLNWLEEWRRQETRLKRAKEQIKIGQISGAVGTYSQVDPGVERVVCDELGLKPAPVSSQILQRDRHAHVSSVLSNLAGTIEKMAVEVRHLQRTEVGEVQEQFKSGQKGSSAMPHKKNPIIAERLSGQARVIRGYTSSIFETQALWHERDLSNSSTERILFPDQFQLIHYMIKKCLDLFENLGVNEDRMERNMDITRGLYYSQRVMLTLSKAGMDRSEAYEIVQELAMRCWEHGEDFEKLIRNDERVTKTLSEDDLENCFDLRSFLRHVDTIYDRVLDD